MPIHLLIKSCITIIVVVVVVAVDIVTISESLYTRAGQAIFSEYLFVQKQRTPNSLHKLHIAAHKRTNTHAYKQCTIYSDSVQSQLLLHLIFAMIYW